MFAMHSKYCSQGWTSQDAPRQACIYSRGLKPFAYCMESFCQSCSTKPFFFTKTVLTSSQFAGLLLQKNMNSVFTRLWTESSLWYQQFDFRQIKTFSWDQSCVRSVIVDAANNCCFYVTTKRAMNFHNNIPPSPIDHFNDQYVLVFDLVSM